MKKALIITSFLLINIFVSSSCDNSNTTTVIEQIPIPKEEYSYNTEEILKAIEEMPSLEELRKNFQISSDTPKSPTSSKIEPKPYVAPKISFTSLNGFSISKDLEKRFNSTLATNSSHAFLFESMDGNITVSFNPDKQIHSASFVKAGFALAGTKKIDEKKASFEDYKIYEERFFTPGSKFDWIYENVDTGYSIEDLMQKMITKSDNIAYTMLIDYFGTSYYNSMLKNLGCKGLQISSYSKWPTTSPRDALIILKEIYRLKDTSKNVAKLYDYLLNTDYSANFLKQALGKDDYVIAHKSGYDGNGRNDNGIVQDKYYISILTGIAYDRNIWFNNIANLCDEVSLEYDTFLQK